MTRLPPAFWPFRIFGYSIVGTLAFYALLALLQPIPLAPLKAKEVLSNVANTVQSPLRVLPIPVNGSLPTFLEHGGDHDELTAAYERALQTVRAEAERLFETRMGLDVQRRSHGVPGTSIETDEEASQLQRYLDCVAGDGAWLWDERGDAVKSASGGVTVHKQSPAFAACDKRFYRGRTPSSEAGWDVRTQLKYRWKPSRTCHDLLPSGMREHWRADPEQIADLPSRRSLCQLLRHKNVLLVGDAATQYLVHDLILDWTSDKPLTCYGDLFCNEHGICGGTLAEGWNGEGWEADESVNDRLPTPPGDGSSGSPLVLQVPESQPKAADAKPRGTIIRYRRSDGFYLRSSPSSPGHDAQYIHPSTGIREINNYALADARRSDVVLINKAPLPFPAPSSSLGGWHATVGTSASQSAALIELATKLTVEIWLPELLESLHYLRAPPSPADQLVIYRSSWRSSPTCTSEDSTPPLSSAPPSLRELFGATTETHALLHDLQVILQNHATRQAVLPRLGIPYLDVEAPLSIWRAGFVAGGPPRNCLQTCLPSPGLALERAVLGGLHRVMAWAWASDEKRSSRWIGDAFVPLRARTQAAKKRL